jgi:hypothetical protein
MSTCDFDINILWHSCPKEELWSQRISRDQVMPATYKHAKTEKLLETGRKLVSAMSQLPAMEVLLRGGVICWVRPEAIQRGPQTSWVDVSWVSWVLAVQLNSAREGKKRWRYIWVDSWQEFFMGGCDKAGPRARGWRISTVRSRCQGMATWRHCGVENAYRVL